MKYFLTLLILSFNFSSSAQTLSGTRSMGMGGIGIFSPDANNLLSNQAGLAEIKSPTVIVATEQKFFLEGLNHSAAGIALPTRSGTFGLIVSNFGFSEFRQQQAGLSYARQLSKGLLIGLQADYFQTRIPEYGSGGTLTFELGLMAELGKGLWIGTHISSPQQESVESNASLPSTLRTGLFYEISSKTSLGIELEKDVDFPMRVRFGVEYFPIDSFVLRAGFSTEPSAFHIGLGYWVNKNLRLELANRFDPELGLTPGAGVVYALDH